MVDLQPRVVLKGYILVSETDIAAITEELPTHVALTRSEAGCLVFEVSQDLHNHLRFNVYEEFDGAESFELHQKRVSKSTWGRVAANVQRCYVVEGFEN